MSTAELIAKLEAAAEGSDYLNDAISAVVMPEFVTPSKFGDYFNYRELRYGNVEVPDYTRSLDAALTLVPADWFISLSRFSDGWYATIKGHSKAPISHEGYQKPAAHALCIAALKAMPK